MVPWAEKLLKETIALVAVNVRKGETEVNGTEVHHFEMDVMMVRLLSDCHSISFWLIIIAQLQILSEVSDSPRWIVAYASRLVGLDGQVRYSVLSHFTGPVLIASYKMPGSQASASNVYSNTALWISVCDVPLLVCTLRRVV